MLILQLPLRNAMFSSPYRFPNAVEIRVELAPKAVFGDEPLNDKLPICAIGQAPVGLEAETFHGSIRFKPQGQLGRVHVNTILFHASVQIDGSCAVLRMAEATEEDFKRTISLAEVLLPAFISAVVHAPVVATDVYGNVGDSFFQLQFRGSVGGAFFADSETRIAERITSYFAKLSKLPLGAQRIFSAHRYLQQARRLRMVSTYPGEFLGERVLNLYKVVEALFASRTANEIRPALKKLGIPDDVAEMVTSIIYVRDQLDAGHMALQALEPAEYELVHRFADRIEDTITWLLIKVVEAAGEGRFQVREAKHKPSERRKLMDELAKRDDLLVHPYETPDIGRIKKR
jgi:hypothetical protein